MTEQTETVTTDYVAAKLHCTLSHANLLCRQGKIKAVKPFHYWLVDKAAFDAKLNGVEVENESSESRTESNDFDI